MSQNTPDAAAEAGPSIRQLVSEVAKDAKHLFDAQAELAKTETQATQKQAAATGGLFGVAAVTGALGGLFLLITIAYVLVALGLPTWAGFGIVTLVLLLIAGITGVMGKKQAGDIKPLALTKVELARTKQALTGGPASTDVAAIPERLPQQR